MSERAIDLDSKATAITSKLSAPSTENSKQTSIYRYQIAFHRARWSGSYHHAGNVTTKYVFTEKDGSQPAVPRFLTPRECARIVSTEIHSICCLVFDRLDMVIVAQMLSVYGLCTYKDGRRDIW